MVGQNLTDGRHGEFGSGVLSDSSAVPRSIYAQATLLWDCLCRD